MIEKPDENEAEQNTAEDAAEAVRDVGAANARRAGLPRQHGEDRTVRSQPWKLRATQFEP